jgi:hypothetical protein
MKYFGINDRWNGPFKISQEGPERVNNIKISSKIFSIEPKLVELKQIWFYNIKDYLSYVCKIQLTVKCHYH